MTRKGVGDARDTVIDQLVEASQSRKIGSSPTAQTIWAHLAEGLAVGWIQPCDHLGPNVPGRIFWVAEAAPDRLLCQMCTIALHAVLDASQLTGTCTACGGPHDRLFTLDLVVGSVAVRASICNRCHAKARRS